MAINILVQYSLTVLQISTKWTKACASVQKEKRKRLRRKNIRQTFIFVMTGQIRLKFGMKGTYHECKNGESPFGFYQLTEA